MNMASTWVDTLAGGAILLSFLLAIASGWAMATLYARRLRDERRAPIDEARDRALSRQLMSLVAQPPGPDVQLPEVGIDQARRVFSHLLQLVRGEDHLALLDLADRMRVPDSAIAHLGDHTAARRVDAMRVLEQFPVPRAVDALLACMGSDPDPEVRLEAAAALARVDQLPPPAAVITMLDLRTRPANRLHEAIFRVCAVRHVDKLKALSRDPSLKVVRPLLVEALGWSGNFSVLSTLAVHGADHNPEVRSAALRAVHKLEHPVAETWVLPLMFDPVDYVRSNAARTSGKLGLRDAIPGLAVLAANPSWWVRKRAVEALALLRPGQPAPMAMIGLRA